MKELNSSSVPSSTPELLPVARAAPAAAAPMQYVGQPVSKTSPIIGRPDSSTSHRLSAVVPPSSVGGAAVAMRNSGETTRGRSRSPPLGAVRFDIHSPEDENLMDVSAAALPIPDMNTTSESLTMGLSALLSGIM